MKKTGKIIKFICGAGNEDFEEIEKLSYVFSSAGSNMIDVSADSNAVNAAKSGINKAGMTNKTSVCVSIGLKDDIHLSKAKIDGLKCNKCKICINSCPRNAVFEKENKIIIDETKCIGCSNCIKACKYSAITSVSTAKMPEEMLSPLLTQKFDCVEFHCTSDNEALILSSWQKIKSMYKGQLSICMNRAKLGDNKIINLLKEMTKNIDNIIIQADGNPMSGGKNDYKSNLQTVAFAQLIKNSNINAVILLSGGTNAKTAEFAKLCDVDIDGVSLGSYARKLVKKYTECTDFWENKTIMENAVNTAKSLIDELLLSLN
ncbi:4Fe-4S binding protein [bacterium]|nr:4Fe-4S binding protein [bacterium]